MKNFYDFFIEELKDVYSAELQLIEALPKMAQAAKSEKLKGAFLDHLEETKDQVDRLEEIGRILDINLDGKTCKAMRGLIQEAQDMIKTPFEDDTKDAALISSAQRVEHYEMAAYGCLKTYAKHLDLSDVEDLLDETLQEEGAADKKLTKIAEGTTFHSGINKKACTSCGCH